MRAGNSHKSDENGVATMIEYILITGVIMTLFIVMLLMVHANFVETPVNTITYSAFTDIGNGLSTRIVDVYAISPASGNISSKFDLPDEIGDRGYAVEINRDAYGQTVDISRDYIISKVAMAGIGASTHGKAMGNTTGAGVNNVRYDSEGFKG
jgi:hypothetical protein